MSDPLKLPALDLNQRYTVDEAVAYLRTSRATLYADINAGAIRVQKRGRRTYITGEEIARVSRAEAAA